MNRTVPIRVGRLMASLIVGAILVVALLVQVTLLTGDVGDNADRIAELRRPINRIERQVVRPICVTPGHERECRAYLIAADDARVARLVCISAGVLHRGRSITLRQEAIICGLAQAAAVIDRGSAASGGSGEVVGAGGTNNPAGQPGAHGGPGQQGEPGQQGPPGGPGAQGPPGSAGLPLVCGLPVKLAPLCP